jgi:hypothetical protein
MECSSNEIANDARVIEADAREMVAAMDAIDAFVIAINC